MKIYKSLVAASMAIVVLTSCEHNVSMETTVYPDGKITKSVAYERIDSSDNVWDKPSKDILGLGEKSGWSRKSRLKEVVPDSVKNKTFIITYEKTFASAKEATAELATSNDSLFQITSKFEKKFKWFYTHIYYSETFHSLNRMEIKPDDYLTPEDYAFIDRLPAEGKKISKADNFYLSELNNRIFEVYGIRAFYEEYFSLSAQLIKENKLESRWIDTLNHRKEEIFELLENKKDLPEDFILNVMDSLKIPLDYKKAKVQHDLLYKKLSAKTNFITTASDGKYLNRINMPWTVVSTNADSTVGNTLLWAPPSIKFLLKDYTMYGECRELNWWAVIVSVLIVGFTGYLFFRKKPS